jgi:hypothetical protein
MRAVLAQQEGTMAVFEAVVWLLSCRRKWRVNTAVQPPPRDLRAAPLLQGLVRAPTALPSNPGPIGQGSAWARQLVSLSNMPGEAGGRWSSQRWPGLTNSGSNLVFAADDPPISSPDFVE